MASQNKKNKARNSFLLNGNENQKIHRMKRIAYYIKAERVDAKKEIKRQEADYELERWDEED